MKKLFTSTPSVEKLNKVLGGGAAYDAVSFSHDELKYFRDFYEMNPEEHRLLQAGADLNLMRAVKHDGMRVMGVLSKFLQRGEDPVKLVLKLLSDQGFDCDIEDVEWAFEEDDV